MVKAEALELYAREQIHVCYKSFHFFKLEVDMGFRNDFDLLRAQDAGCLPKLANPTAPAGPHTELQKSQG